MFKKILLTLGLIISSIGFVSCGNGDSSFEYLDGTQIDQVQKYKALGIRTEDQLNGIFSKKDTYKKLVGELEDGSLQEISFVKNDKKYNQDNFVIYDFIEAENFYFVFVAHKGTYEDYLYKRQHYSVNEKGYSHYGMFYYEINTTSAYGYPSLFLLSKNNYKLFSFDSFAFKIGNITKSDIDKSHLSNGIQFLFYSTSFFYLNIDESFTKGESQSGLYRFSLEESGIATIKIYGSDFGMHKCDIYGNSFLDYHHEDRIFSYMDIHGIKHDIECPTFHGETIYDVNLHTSGLFSYNGHYLNSNNEFVAIPDTYNLNESLYLNFAGQILIDNKSGTKYWMDIQRDEWSNEIQSCSYYEVEPIDSLFEIRRQIKAFSKNGQYEYLDIVSLGKKCYGLLKSNEIEYYNLTEGTSSTHKITLDSTYNVTNIDYKNGYLYISGTKGFEPFGMYVTDNWEFAQNIEPRPDNFDCELLHPISVSIN